MLIVYVAGPFYGPSDWDRQENIRRARVAGLEVARMGCYPFVPHSNTCYYFGTLPESFWVDGCLEMVARCDSILVLPGYLESKGTQLEMARATELGKQTFLRLEDLWTMLCKYGLQSVDGLRPEKYVKHLHEVQESL